MRDRQLIFHQGDTIAFSGNTGSSGDHLHFEVRNTRSEHTLESFAFYKIRDSRITGGEGVYLYRESASGCVGLVEAGGFETVGERLLYARTVEYSGRENRYCCICYGLYRNDSWNKLGIYRLGVVAGKDTLCHADGFLFF